MTDPDLYWWPEWATAPIPYRLPDSEVRMALMIAPEVYDALKMRPIKKSGEMSWRKPNRIASARNAR